MRACVPVVAVALGLGFGLGACTPDSEPTPEETTTRAVQDPSTGTTSSTETPTETETPTLTPEEENIEAAKQTVVDYYAALARVGEGAYQTWTTDLAPYWGTPELQQPLSAYYQQLADSGQRTEGSVVLDMFSVTEYVAGQAGQNRPLVRLEVCVDSSAVTQFGANGEPVQVTSPSRFITQLDLLKQSETFWSVNAQDVQVERPC